MNMFSGIKEAVDNPGIDKESKPRVNLDAEDKFEKIMDDERLPEGEIEGYEKKYDLSFLKIFDKFEALFTSDFDSDIGCSDANEDIGCSETNEETESDVDDTNNQEREPNSKYNIGEDTYETDDKGTTYKKNGALLPNVEYTVNGNTYKTDENGNKVSCDGIPKVSEEGKRNNNEQRESGGKDRREGDQGGHIIARILGGSEGEENLVPMRGTINQGDYKKMELEIRRALEDGKKVTIHIELKYDGSSSRPTKIIATYYIDGNKTEIVFDNEENSTKLLEGLDDLISDDDYNELVEEIEDMKNDGHSVSITSVKTEYDENGNVKKVIVGVLDESTGIKSYKVYDAR